MMNYELNPFVGMSFEELELAYEYYSWSDDVEAVHLVADAFCLKAELDVMTDN